jgi:hypothetical protein
MLLFQLLTKLFYAIICLKRLFLETNSAHGNNSIGNK